MQINEICRLCLIKPKDTKSSLTITAEDDDAEQAAQVSDNLVVQVLKRHFCWFDLTLLTTPNIICQKCWGIVKEFDDFYNLIRLKHQEYEDNLPLTTLTGNIKLEQITIKEERDVNIDSEDEATSTFPNLELSLIETVSNIDEDDISNSDSKNNFAVTSKREFVAERNPRYSNHSELLQKYFTLKCEMCEKRFKSLTQSRQHYKIAHNLPNGYMVCCDKKFSNLRVVKEHLRWHEEQPSSNLKETTINNPAKPFKCSNCDKTYPKKCLLTNHLQKNHVKRTKNPNIAQGNELIRKHFIMECDLCNLGKFETFNDVSEHFKTTHVAVEAYLRCCGKKFVRFATAVQHCQWHENPEQFQCQHCQRCFIDRKCLISHIQYLHTPAEQRTYKCDMCERTFAKEHLLAGHKRKNHTKFEDKTFECDICGKRFHIMSLLRLHVDQIHENKYSHICDICAKPFKAKKSYDAHYLSEHTDIDQKVQCDLCGKWLKTKEGLKTHMKIHYAETELCKLCGFESKNRKSLREHMKRAHLPPKLQCTICDKMFKEKRELIEHIAIHTGENDLYKCTFCPMTFRSSSNMCKHRRLMHSS